MVTCFAYWSFQIFSLVKVLCNSPQVQGVWSKIWIIFCEDDINMIKLIMILENKYGFFEFTYFELWMQV